MRQRFGGLEVTRIDKTVVKRILGLTIRGLDDEICIRFTDEDGLSSMYFGREEIVAFYRAIRNESRRIWGEDWQDV